MKIPKGKLCTGCRYIHPSTSFCTLFKTVVDDYSKGVRVIGHCKCEDCNFAVSQAKGNI